MAAKVKTRWAQLKIGLVAIFALLIMAVLVVLMSGTNPLFKRTSPVYAYFDDSFAMTPGATPVRLNGILIGKVGQIDLSGSSEVNRAVKVTLNIDNDSLAQIPVDSMAGLPTVNLLGGRFVNITRGKSQQTIQAGGEIMTKDTAEIQDMVEQGKTTLAALQTILKRVENIVIEIEDGKGSIGKFIRDPVLFDNLVAVTNDARDLIQAFNNPDGTLGKIINDPALYNDVRGTVARVDRMLDGLNNGEGTLGKLLKDDALHKHLDELIGKLNGTVDKINAGQGTLGQLVVNPQLYDSMNGTAKELQSLMKDLHANPKKFLTIQLKIF